MWCDPPKGLELAQLLTDLLGKSVKVKELSGPQSRALVGPVTVFDDPEGKAAAVSVADFEFAAYLGAALTMLPPGVAEQAVRGKKIAESIEENFGEVMNVLSSKLTKSPNRVIIRLPFKASTPLPDDAKPIKAKPAKRADYDVEVQGYGTGKVSFFLI